MNIIIYIAIEVITLLYCITRKDRELPSYVPLPFPPRWQVFTFFWIICSIFFTLIWTIIFWIWNKVGDKVRIKSLDWYNANKEQNSNKYLDFIASMSKYCGKEATITKVIDDFYFINIDKGNWRWHDYMFEENMEERIIKVSLNKAREWYKAEGDLKGVALQAYSEELENEFPKTWEECYNLLGYVNYRMTSPELERPIVALTRLLMCREIYRKGWKPDWTDCNHKYAITYLNGRVSTEIFIHSSHPLSFQSTKVRDEFLKNFKDLIEQAKELI